MQGHTISTLFPFFFNDTATTEIYTLSLHDALPILALDPSGMLHAASGLSPVGECRLVPDLSTLTALPFARGQAMVSCDMTEPDATTPWEGCPRSALKRVLDRKSTRLNSSHANISYA